MNHMRPVLIVIRAHTSQVKAFRKVEIELDRAQLPGAVQGVRHVGGDLGPVKSAIFFIDG